MIVFQTNKSKSLAIMVLVLMGFFSLSLFAQEKEESKSKLDQLNGKVEKITVKVDGKDVVFEGKEAQKLADQMRSEKRIKIISEGDLKQVKEGNGKVFVFRSKNKGDDSDIKSGNVTKKINVEDKDGKKVVTITTTIDGKEETKTYEGEEAEKFLKDENGMKHITVTLNDGDDKSQDRVIYFNKKMDGKVGMRDGCCCCGNGEGMTKMKHMSGKGMKKMIIKKYDDNDKETEKNEVEKKIEKK
ncbi:MAG: hypothetical protein ACYC5R_09180 [Melioribacteraceae bacterium]